MHIVTFFAPKGGSGRTTSVMAVASALIESGHVVEVLDLTEQACPSSVKGQSFLSQWADNMRASNIVPEQFTTASASDYAGTFQEVERFQEAEIDFLLVDTPRNPNSAVIDLLGISDLVILPVTGAHEAAWVSAWINDNPQPVGRFFGLITGCRSDEERQLTRVTFTGAPVLSVDLWRLAAFGQQIDRGHLHLKPDFDTFIAGKLTPDGFESAMDWTCACLIADALSREIISLIDHDGSKEYLVTQPLATGDTFAHLNAVLAQSQYQPV